MSPTERERDRQTYIYIEREREGGREEEEETAANQNYKSVSKDEIGEGVVGGREDIKQYQPAI